MKSFNRYSMILTIQGRIRYIDSAFTMEERILLEMYSTRLGVYKFQGCISGVSRIVKTRYRSRGYWVLHIRIPI